MTTRDRDGVRPPASSDIALRRMQRQRRRDTRPELAVRRAVFARGLRYRVDVAPLRGRRRADLVFPRAKVAVYIDGCFWHGCPQHATEPKANRDWWREKLARNRKRDADTDARLLEEGWLPLRIWEHEDSEAAALTIVKAVRGRLA
jgi:DNA mismatch endonuclease, patch repair protein